MHVLLYIYIYIICTIYIYIYFNLHAIRNIPIPNGRFSKGKPWLHRNRSTMDLAMAIVDIYRMRKIKEVGGKGLSGEAW
jgi:hypothetical protein